MDTARSNEPSIVLRPIGRVRSAVTSQQTGGFQDIHSEITLEPQFSDYVVGLDEYSHLHVLYWLSEMTETHGLHRPQGNTEAPIVGMFACR